MEPTKENVRFCQNLVGRFQSLRFFNTLTDLSLSIIADALLTAARSQAQAELLVNSWIAEHSEYPTAADINLMAREMTRNASAIVLPEPCNECREIPGYIRTEQIVKIGVFAGEQRYALALCSCDRGKALRESALRSRERPASPDFTRVEDLLG